MADPRFYDLVAHLWRGGSHSYYWTPDTDEGKLSFWMPANRPREVSGLWKTINVYFGVHPSRIEKGQRERARIEDVEVVNCLFAEFDLAPGQPPQHLLDAIQSLDTPPSVIVFSGGGYHAYWLLAQTYHIDDDAARQRIIEIQYAWDTHVTGDNHVKDLARVLRVPGTYNRKPEYAPNYPQVEVVKFDMGQQYELDELTTQVESIIEAARAKRSTSSADVVVVDLDDHAIVERMRQSDVAIDALWGGDLSAYNDDHSDADLALCNHLAFWFGRDRERMDKAFRYSGLYREKWLRDDYRNRTLDKAIASCTNTYTPPNGNLGGAQDLADSTVHANGAAPVGTTTPPAGSAPSAPASVKQKKIKSGDYLQTLADLGYEFRLNELDDTIEVNGRKINDVLAAQIRTQMRDLGYEYMAPIEDAYIAHAASNRFHPIKHYLKSLTWDGNNYIGLLTAYIRDNHTKIVYPGSVTKTVFEAMFQRWLVGAVAKVFTHTQNPMLVLDGAQGKGKSTFVHWLGSPMPSFFIEGPIRPDDKEYERHLATKWIWEVAEVGATTRRQDVEALKHYLTKEDVTFRIPWGKHAIVKPALASFVGTINNETGFLTDNTGSRRFISVHLRSIDWGYKAIDPNQIWAQAYHFWAHGESSALLPEEVNERNQINTQYQVEDPYESWILRYYEIDPANIGWLTTTQEITDLLQVKGIRGETRTIQMNISKTLKGLGLEQLTNSRPRMWKGIRGKPILSNP